MATAEDFEQIKSAMIKLQEGMSTMEKQHATAEKTLKLEIETLRSEKLEQDAQMEEMRRELKKLESVDAGGVKDIETASKELRGYDYKSAPKPVPYDFGDEHEFHAWKDLMMALMTSYDGRWETILEAIEKMGKKIVDMKVKEEIKKELGMDDPTTAKCVKILYTTLLQYTKGEAKSKVTSCGMAGAWESYRYIVNRGKNITMTAVMQKRMRVMNPDAAKTPEDVETKLQTWKTDMRILLEASQEQDIKMVANQDQMITILISMLPDKIAEHLMSKYDVGMTTLEEMEEKLRDHLDKIIDNQQRHKGTKKIGQVAMPAEEEGQEGYEWAQEWDQDWGNYWIRTAAKRARTDDPVDAGTASVESAENSPNTNVGLSKGGKGKGKGKGSPKGGCHECGGSHFVRDCPVRQQRKGGKGKGKDWSSVQPRYWNNWNPGFMTRQWSSWRPGNKGKGKGKFGFSNGYGGKGEGSAQNMDVNKLTFPPLCSVSNSGSPMESGSYEWGGQDQCGGSDWSTDQGLWMGAVMKKKSKPSFSHTSEFDQAIHKSKSWKGPNAIPLSIHRGVPRETIVGYEEEEHVNQIGISGKNEEDKKKEAGKAYHGVPRATIDKCNGFNHVNKFNVLQDNEEDLCGECESGMYHIQKSTGMKGPSQTLSHTKVNGSSGEDQGDVIERCDCSGQHRRQQAVKQLQTLQRANAKQKHVAACGESKRKWQCLSVAVDSGACDNVIDPKDVGLYEEYVKDTEASRNQENFLAANGEEIPNYGEVKVPIITRERTLRGITFQAAGVAKGLLSVEKMNESGHVVVFDGDDSYVVNKWTGEMNQLRRQDGNFMLDIWIPPPETAQEWGFGRLP